ncbi:MAG TPA: mycothiol synthase, partial [Streptosporangiaceae bacterium]|nr:mycothiol synthase [Streptosporangiaceae bacterium]
MQISGRLTAPEAATVLDLVQRATAADGVSPLSEHVLLQLRYEGDRQSRNVLLRYQGKLAGYGHLDPAGSAGEAAGE